MKPALFFAIPPLAFIAAMMLAALVPADDAPKAKASSSRSSPRKREAAIEGPQSSSKDIPAILAEMERQIVHFPPPEITIHDGEGIESRLLADKANQSFCGGGFQSIEYSMDWARENPTGMFEWFNHSSTADADQRHSLAQTLFSEWAKQDMAAALAAIPSMPHAESRAQALVSTLEVLCQRDPARARELLLQNLDSLESLKTVRFEYDAGRARTELLTALPQGRIRSLLLAEHINIMCRDYADGKAAPATELWNSFSDEERRDLVAAGVRSDRNDEYRLDGLEDLIKQHAETTNDSAQASRFLEQYGKSWAERDPSGALAWAMEHLKGKERTDQSLSLLAHAASKNFDGAMRAWQSLPEDSLREKAATILAKAAPADREVDKAMLEEVLPKPGKW